MKRNIIFIFSLALVLTVGFSSVGYPKEKGYPTKRIQIVVNHRAGGGIDLFFRQLSEELKNYWKVPVSVLNKAGAMGLAGCNTVVKAEPDGYTLLGTLLGILTTVTAAKPDGILNLLRDFAPVLIDAGYCSGIYTVRSDSKFKSLKDIIKYAKKNPGDLIYGSGPRGGETFLEWELLKRLAKVDIPIVPYSGGSEVMLQLLGGHIHIGGSSEFSANKHIKAGKLRPIAVDIKSSVFPDVPTFVESGYPEINLFGSVGLFGPKGLSPAVTKSWESALKVVLKDPKYLASLKRIGGNANFLKSTEKMNEFLKGEIEKYSRFTPKQLGWE